jgi:hypothetical protein
MQRLLGWVLDYGWLRLLPLPLETDRVVNAARQTKKSVSTLPIFVRN